MSAIDHSYDSELVSRLRLAFPPTSLLIGLTLASCLIAVVGGAARFWISLSQASVDYSHEIMAVLNRIDIGHEPSLVQWFSSAQLAAAAIVAMVLGFAYSGKNRTDARYWMLIAVVMLALSIDEAIMIHEMANRAMNLALPATSAFHFAWTIPAMIVAIIVALVLMNFILRLKPRTRNLFVLSGVCFVGGAVGMELMSGLVIDFWGLVELPSGQFAAPSVTGSVAFAVCQSIEEFLEMVGVSIFIFAAYEHLLTSFRMHRRDAKPGPVAVPQS